MAVLGSTNLTGCNSIPDFIAAGSLMFFQSTTAPTGWTKQTTHNDKALRVVTGTATPGGTSSFSSIFAASRGPFPGTVGNTTLSTPQIPSHSHPAVSWAAGYQFNIGYHENITPSPKTPPFVGNAAIGAINTGPTGGGGSHTHPWSTDSISFAVQYVDLIICSKN